MRVLVKTHLASLARRSGSGEVECGLLTHNSRRILDEMGVCVSVKVSSFAQTHPAGDVEERTSETTKRK